MTPAELVARVWRPGTHTLEFNDGSKREVHSPDVPPPIEVVGPWNVEIPGEPGRPPSATFAKLVSWTQRPEDGDSVFLRHCLPIPRSLN